MESGICLSLPSSFLVCFYSFPLLFVCLCFFFLSLALFMSFYVLSFLGFLYVYFLLFFRWLFSLSPFIPPCLFFCLCLFFLPLALSLTVSLSLGFYLPPFLLSLSCSFSICLFFLSVALYLSVSSFLPWLSFCRQSPLIKNDPAIFFLTKMYIDPASQATDTLEDFWQLCSRLPQYACSQFLTDKDDSKLSSLHSAQYTPPLTRPTPPISPPPPLSVTPDHMRPLSPLSGRNSRVSNHELSLLDWLPPPAPCRSPTVPRRRSQPQQSSLLLPRSLTLTPRLPRNYMPSLPSTEDLTFYRCWYKICLN